MANTDLLQGLSGSVAVKPPCRAVSSTNLVLSGLQTVDGVDLASGDRVLLAGQADSVENGIYVVNTSDWSRSLDCDGPGDIVKGTIVLINEGTTYGGTFWRETASDPLPGSTSMSWANGVTDTASTKAEAGNNTDINSLRGIGNSALSNGVGLEGHRDGNLYMQWVGHGNAAFLQFLRSQGTRQAVSAVDSGGLVLGQIDFKGWNGSTEYSYGAYIRAVSSEAYSAGNTGAYLDFFTTTTGGGAGSTTQRSVRLNADGSATFYFDLTVNADFHCLGDVNVTGTVTAASFTGDGSGLTGLATTARNYARAAITATSGTTTAPSTNTAPTTSTAGTKVAEVTITPSTTSKTVQVKADLSVRLAGATAAAGVVLSLFRGTTLLATKRARTDAHYSTTLIPSDVEWPFSFDYQDSPASVATQTYSIYVGRWGAGTTWYVNGGVSDDLGGSLDNHYLHAEETGA